MLRKILFLIYVVNIVFFVTSCTKTLQPLAHVKQPVGTVEAMIKEGENFIKAIENLGLFSGSVIRTLDNSFAKLLFINGIQVSINPETYFKITAKPAIGEQTSGSAIYQVPKSNEIIEINTPHGVTAVLGTVFKLEVSKKTTTITVAEGKVRFTNMKGVSKVIESNQQAIVSAEDENITVNELDPITIQMNFDSTNKLPPINQR